MNPSLPDQQLMRAEQAFQLHLSLFTDSAMTPAAYANLLTEDAVLEHPYAPSHFPNRVEGREAVTAYWVDVTRRGATNWQFTDLTFSATPDPQTVFVEFNGQALVPATGKTYHQVYVGRLTMRGDKIAHYREFWNPTWILEAFAPEAPKEDASEATSHNR